MGTFSSAEMSVFSKLIYNALQFQLSRFSWTCQANSKLQMEEQKANKKVKMILKKSKLGKLPLSNKY